MLFLMKPQSVVVIVSCRRQSSVIGRRSSVVGHCCQLSSSSVIGRRSSVVGHHPVNVTLKANNSQAKEINRLVIQKKMEAVLTSMDNNNTE